MKKNILTKKNIYMKNINFKVKMFFFTTKIFFIFYY